MLISFFEIFKSLKKKNNQKQTQPVISHNVPY